MNNKNFVVLQEMNLNLATGMKAVEYDESKDFNKNLQCLVDGWLENVNPIGLPEGYCMVVDEEGLIKRKRPNYIATKLYNPSLHDGNIIVGTAIIVKLVNKSGEYDWDTLTIAEAAYIMDYIKEYCIKEAK